VREALQAPLADRPDARARIMQRIRTMPAPLHTAAPMRASRWRRRGALSGAGGLVLSAVMALMLMVRHGNEVSVVAHVQPQLFVLGDSVVPVHGADSLAAVMSGRWLDTMRIVEFVVHGAQVRRAAVQAPVPHGRAEAPVLTLARASAVEWRGRALVSRAARNVTFVVNDVPLAPTPMPRTM
jgi:hypothetical protein